jgi:hypothetical protein
VDLGAENRTKVIAACVLGALAIGVIVWQMYPSPPSPAAKNAAPPQPAAAAKKGGPAVNSLDPTLRYDWLKVSEGAKYEGNGKNIFVAQVEIPPVRGNPTTDHKTPPAPQPFVQPGPLPLPPINLKFYGFATKTGDPKKVFLQEGDDIFIASEGDIIDRRYKIVHIYPLAVEVEDVLNNNRQQIPLTQGVS